MNENYFHNSDWKKNGEIGIICGGKHEGHNEKLET